MKWLIDNEAFKELQQIKAAVSVDASSVAAGVECRALGTLEKKQGGESGVIKIHGPILESSDFLLDILGHTYTTYSNVLSAARKASSSGLKTLFFDIDSPGGTVLSLAPTMDAIRALGVETVAVVTGQASSAAYMLASQADKVASSHESNIIGSYGAKVSVTVDDNEVEVSNTASPKKTPDLKTEEGKNVMRETLDDLYSLISSRVAKARGLSTKEIDEKFGQGAEMSAKKALAAGMIDEINPNIFNDNTAGGTPNKTKGSAMDRQKLKAEHPELYKEIYTLGITHERARVKSHLALGASSGDMETATKDVEEGRACDDAVRTQHHVAMMNSLKLEASKKESSGTPTTGQGEDPAEQANLDENGKTHKALSDEFNAMDGVEVGF